jgi:hypothetical protein
MIPLGSTSLEEPVGDLQEHQEPLACQAHPVLVEHPVAQEQVALLDHLEHPGQAVPHQALLATCLITTTFSKI